MPQTICIKCAEKLVDFHLFRLILVEARRRLLADRLVCPAFKVEYDHDITFIAIKNESDAEDVAHNSEVRETTDGAIEVAFAFDEGSIESYHPENDCHSSKEDDRPPSVPIDEQKPAFKCYLCSAKLHSEIGLKKHLQYVHKSTSEAATEHPDLELNTLFANAKRLICEKCNRSFAKRAAFLKHFRYVHLKEAYRSNIKCPLCARKFSGTGNLHFCYYIV